MQTKGESWGGIQLLRKHHTEVMTSMKFLSVRQERERGEICFASISCGEKVVTVKDVLQKVQSA